MSKRISILFKVVSLSVPFWSALAWAICPEFPNDNGLCDTLYVKVYPPDAKSRSRIPPPDMSMHRASRVS